MTKRILLKAALVALVYACVTQDVLGASSPVSAESLDKYAVTPWERGRTTFYGRDGYSIHSGACHYGSIPYPYYVAALSDWWPAYINGAYEHNKCGTCFELQCDPNGRGYCRGDRLNASIIVRVTDRCPCKHENPSNQRWCCGDMPHFDVSHEAFGELASHTGGWVYLQWREIECPEAIGLGGDLLVEPMNWEPYCDEEGEKTLADIAKENGLTTFLEALWRAGPEVYDAISDKSGQHSVVAPTNEAFKKTAKEMGMTVEELLDEPSMHYIMKYHILQNDIDFKTLMVDESGCDDKQPGSSSCEEEKKMGKCGPTYESKGWCRQTCGNCVGKDEKYSTLANMDLSFLVSSDGIVIDKGHGIHEAKVLEDLSGCNGNLAVVNNVLFPMCKANTAKGIVELAQEAGLYHFTAAVWKANVFNSTLGIGREWGLYTVLAPTDEAFEAAAKKLKFSNFTEFLNSDKLVSVMQNHVIKGKQHIGYFERTCADIAVPKEVIESYPVASTWNSSTVECTDLEALGLCSNKWISGGYCRKTCGRCIPFGADKVREEFESLNDKPLLFQPSDRKATKQMNRIFSVDEGQQESQPKDMAYIVRVELGQPKAVKNKDNQEGADVLVPDVLACNGFLNIVNSVLI